MLNLNDKSSILILTGAGISKESGLATFRENDGLWEKYKIEEVATPEAFQNNPELVQEFYNLRRHQLIEQNIFPNSAHEALARLEHQFRGKLTIVTQNVDDLHERAGSSRVLHMHGELKKSVCIKCQTVFNQEDDLSTVSVCPKCYSLGTLRPNIVWFGEMPFYMDQIYELLDECDLFVSIGTSMQVYPAASFVEQCPHATRVEINTETTSLSYKFHQSFLGLASVEVPKLVDAILDQHLY